MKELFGISKNGVEIYLHTERSHALTHFSHHPKLRGIAKRLVGTLDVTTDTIRLEQDMNEEVGTSDLVETTDQDEVVYAMRPLRSTYSRFVKNKKPVPTSWITIDLRKVGEFYFLYTAFVGRLTPSFPGGNYLPEQSKEFWSKHALVWGTQEVVPGTETDVCPW